MPNPVKPLTILEHTMQVTSQFADKLYATETRGQLNRLSVSEARDVARNTVYQLLTLRANVNQKTLEALPDMNESDALLMTQLPEYKEAVAILTKALVTQGSVDADEAADAALEAIHNLASKKYFTDKEEAVFDYKQVIEPLVRQSGDVPLAVPSLQLISHYLQNLQLSKVNFVGEQVKAYIAPFANQPEEELTQETRQILFDAHIQGLEAFLEHQRYAERLADYNRQQLEFQRGARPQPSVASVADNPGSRSMDLD